MDKIKILIGESRHIHVLGITETKLDNNILDSEITIDGYTVIRRDRISGLGGGVCMFIRDDLNWDRRYDLECDEIEAIWIEMSIKHSKSILINVTYKPPESSRHLNKNFTALFFDKITTALVENKETLIAGDFNCNYNKVTDQREIKDMFKLNGFKQLIKSPTRINKSSATLIDLIFTTHEQYISKSLVYGYGISDHDLTGIIRKMNCKKYEYRKHVTRNYKHFCSESYVEDLKSIPWAAALNMNSLKSFVGLLQELIKKLY